MPVREAYIWKPALIETVQAMLDAGQTPSAAARAAGLKPKSVLNAIQQKRLVNPAKPAARNKTDALAVPAVVSAGDNQPAA